MHSPTLIHFQLKYCERCGGIWLRPDGVATPYCAVCQEFMAELPLSARAPRRKNHVQAAGALSILCIFAFGFTATMLLARCAA